MKNAQTPIKRIPRKLLHIKILLERPGIGKRRHKLAERFRDRKDVPIEWIREWINAEWYVIGHKYLWLAAMNACIGRDDVSLDLIDQGLRKADPDTFNAAIQACRGRNIPFEVILQWYDLGNAILRLAAINACIGNPGTPDWFAEQALNDPDIRIRRIAQNILSEAKPD